MPGGPGSVGGGLGSGVGGVGNGTCAPADTADSPRAASAMQSQRMRRSTGDQRASVRRVTCVSVGVVMRTR